MELIRPESYVRPIERKKIPLNWCANPDRSGQEAGLAEPQGNRQQLPRRLGDAREQEADKVSN
jgi:hypothetical protein